MTTSSMASEGPEAPSGWMVSSTGATVKAKANVPPRVEAKRPSYRTTKCIVEVIVPRGEAEDQETLAVVSIVK